MGSVSTTRLRSAWRRLTPQAPETFFMPDSFTGSCKAGRSPVISLPNGAISRIPSPDEKWILVFECPNNCSERKLWVEQRGMPGRRLVSEYERSLAISWAPNGSLFFVNDAYASNEAPCYVVDPITLKTTDLAKVIETEDAGVRKFF